MKPKLNADLLKARAELNRITQIFYSELWPRWQKAVAVEQCIVHDEKQQWSCEYFSDKTAPLIEKWLTSPVLKSVYLKCMMHWL